MISLSIEALIIIVICIGAYKGWKYGGITSAVNLVATIFIFVAAFYLKDIIAPLMYNNLPFFKFAGVFEGISSLNILLYVVLAYIVSIIILLIVLAIIIKVTKILDKLVNLTIILALPNKLLGLLFGALQYYIIVYFLVFIFLQIPYTSADVKDTKLGMGMINNTPILSTVTNELYSTYNEVYNVCVESQKDENKDKKDVYNRLAVEIMVNHKVVSFEDVRKLRDARKIEGPEIDNYIKEYANKDR